MLGKESDKDTSIIHQWRKESKEKSVTYFEQFISICEREGALVKLSKAKQKCRHTSFHFIQQCLMNILKIRKLKNKL